MYHNLLLEHAHHLCFHELEVDLAAREVVVEQHSSDLCEVVQQQCDMFEEAHDSDLCGHNVAILESDCLQAELKVVSKQIKTSKE